MFGMVAGDFASAAVFILNLDWKRKMGLSSWSCFIHFITSSYFGGDL